MTSLLSDLDQMADMIMKASGLEAGSEYVLAAPASYVNALVDELNERGIEHHHVGLGDQMNIEFSSGRKVVVNVSS